MACPNMAKFAEFIIAYPFWKMKLDSFYKIMEEILMVYEPADFEKIFYGNP
jgi:hypothetical protein